VGEIADDVVAAEIAGVDYETYMIDLAAEQQAKDRKREKRRLKQLRRRARKREACKIEGQEGGIP
jgi:transcriptional accessory protein Tex/SPT6